ncbi:MAG: hypothetical protein ACUVSE_06240 [Armatimonadota bacterium]
MHAQQFTILHGASIAQVSGQSCGQTVLTSRTLVLSEDVSVCSIPHPSATVQYSPC